MRDGNTYLTKQIFNNLYVICLWEINKYYQTRWLCLCKCGNQTIVSGYSLKNGSTKSCGCSHIVHGHVKNNKKSITYQSWQSMLLRCRKDTNYIKNKITVCERWLKFENFLEDMGERPSSKYTLDRINNEGIYEPNNCRWATKKQQARNRKNNKLREFEGKIKCDAEWEEEYNLPRGLLYSRIDVSKWDIKRALFSRPKRSKKNNERK